MTRHTISILIALTACGGSIDDRETDLELSQAVAEDTFRELFAERFCDKYTQCNAGAPCVESEIQAGNDTGTDCVFSQTKGQECLEASWPCIGSAAEPYLDIPLVCMEVWECS